MTTSVSKQIGGVSFYTHSYLVIRNRYLDSKRFILDDQRESFLSRGISLFIYRCLRLGVLIFQLHTRRGESRLLPHFFLLMPIASQMPTRPTLYSLARRVPLGDSPVAGALVESRILSLRRSFPLAFSRSFARYNLVP